jgi:hypothetical protein
MLLVFTAQTRPRSAPLRTQGQRKVAEAVNAAAMTHPQDDDDAMSELSELPESYQSSGDDVDDEEFDNDDQDKSGTFTSKGASIKQVKRAANNAKAGNPKKRKHTAPAAAAASRKTVLKASKSKAKDGSNSDLKIQDDNMLFSECMPRNDELCSDFKLSPLCFPRRCRGWGVSTSEHSGRLGHGFS